MYRFSNLHRNITVKYNFKSLEKVYYIRPTSPQNILKAQVQEDYLRAGRGRSFFWELPESINTISTKI